MAFCNASIHLFSDQPKIKKFTDKARAGKQLKNSYWISEFTNFLSTLKLREAPLKRRRPKRRPRKRRRKARKKKRKEERRRKKRRS